MKEIITANNKNYECTNVSIGLESVSFTVRDYTASEMMSDFEDVDSLTVSFEDEKEPHGVYQHLKLESVTTNADDLSVTVRMHIKSEIERRLDALEESQEVQNGAIIELGEMLGGEA